MTSRTETTRRETDPILQTVRMAKEAATRMMKESGHDVDGGIRVRVDPQLPFMGYTMPMNDGTYTIVVAGNAVNSGMLEGLLTHEMSHIYRMKSHHPSHNTDIIEKAVESFGRETAKHDYQQKIMHDILNDVQDLYADDIAFEVFRKGTVLPADQMTRFLQSWVKDEPDSSGGEGGEARRWANGAILVHNARALAQMQRHNVRDTGNVAAESNKRFLSKLPRSMTENFDYFQEVLTRLPEDITEDAYRKLLRGYIGKFLETVRGV